MRGKLIPDLGMGMECRYFLLILIVLSAGCDRSETAGEVILRNDIQDAEYNEIVVDQLVSTGGASGFKATLKPGDEIALPGSSITGFRVTRAYKDFSRLYGVSCPAKKGRTVMKLIDIHLNRLPSGCKLMRAGEMRDGIVRWK